MRLVIISSSLLVVAATWVVVELRPPRPGRAAAAKPVVETRAAALVRAPPEPARPARAGKPTAPPRADVGGPRALERRFDRPLDAADEVALAAALDRRVASEGGAPSWANALGQALGHVAGSRLRTIDCGGTLCRAVVVHDDADARERWIGQLPLLLPARIQAYAQADGDETRIYVGQITTR